MRLKDLPLDLLQETTAVLDRYVRARRKNKLHREQAHLQEELQDMRTDLAEIQALTTYPAKGVATDKPGAAEGENHA
jgi:uncharacterized protein YeeX (DUF496 family)